MWIFYDFKIYSKVILKSTIGQDDTSDLPLTTDGLILIIVQLVTKLLKSNNLPKGLELRSDE